MNPNSIKVIVCDIDGTILTDEKKMLNETKKALIEAQASGIRLVLASSRNYFMLEEIVKELKMDQYGGFCITLNGTIVVRCSDRKEWRHQLMDRDLAYELFDYAKEMKYFMIFESDKGLQLKIPPGLIWAMPFYYGIRLRKRYLNIRNLNFKLFGEFRFSPDQDLRIVRNKNELVGPVIKAGFIRITPGMSKAMAKLEEKFKGRIDVIRISTVWSDIMPKGMNKAKGFELIQGELGYGLENSIAFGDAENDIALLQQAKIGIAMENGFDSLKEVADDTTLSNNANGVYHGLKKYKII